MRYIVFPTEDCKRAAATEGLLDDIGQLAVKVEQDQSIANWEQYLPSPFLAKKLGRYRLIAERRIWGNDTILCLLTLIHRGKSAYERFYKELQLLWPRPSDEELREFLQSKASLPDSLPEPYEEEVAFLGPSSERQLTEAEGTIYESKEWIDSIAQDSSRPYLSKYYDVLIRVIEDDQAKGLGKVVVGQEGIYFIRFEEPKATFLIAPLSRNTIPAIGALEQKYKPLIEKGITDRHRVLLQYSGRSYPASLLYEANETPWIEIQQSEAGNLALSPEESGILNSVRDVSRPVNEPRFPLFINGGPGSGKSTILQYLFADYLHSYLARNLGNRELRPPLYLTYSHDLLEAAKSHVRTILKCNAQKVASDLDLDSEICRACFDQAFAEFHSLLRSCLPHDERVRFSDEKRIRFRDFRCLFESWIKKNPRGDLRKLSPELAWHVIRTYLKGMREESDGWFDTHSYEELPTKQKTVGQDVFERIHEFVWQGWWRKKCEDEGLWDDQDLARRVLDTPGNIPENPVVFCDEAQDFTKIELELILRFSLFSRRAIQPWRLRDIPFAFAGDPYQTLNPTGFEWGAAQAGFYEKILQSLDPNLSSGLRFNYRALELNYRSARRIVAFCNAIQLLRQVLFGQKILTLQNSWFEDDLPGPVYFDVGDANCREKMLDQEELVVLLPCQEGEEAAYAESDSFLKGITVATVASVRNFFSSIRAKGLEFSRVVLYKFGEEFLANYPHLLDPLVTGKPHSEHPETMLPLEYFMNRLYVAASRPKKRLFIVDTKRAIDEFWDNKFLRDTRHLLSLSSDGKCGEISEPNLGNFCWVQPGQIESWSQDRDKPEELAKLFRDRGTAQGDSYMLELASSNFIRSGNLAEARKCDAVRFELEGNYAEAGDAYIENEDYENALRVFWRGRCFSRIRDESYFKRHSMELRWKMADFAESAMTPASCAEFLSVLARETDMPQWTAIVTEPQFSGIFKRLAKCLNGSGERDPAFWKRMHVLASHLRFKGLDLAGQTEMAELAYKANEFQDAIDVWNASGLEPKPEDYFNAKARLTAEAWETQKAVGGGKVEPLEAARAYVRVGKDHEAAKIFNEFPSNEIFAILPKGSSGDVLVIAGRVKLRVAVAKWRDAIDLVGTARISDRPRLQNLLLYEIAKSSSLPLDASKDDLARISSYLRATLLESKSDDRVPMKIAGIAIERGNKVVDSLEFYERYWKDRTALGTEEEINFALQRWVKCKSRHAEILSSGGRVIEADKLMREAQEMADRHRIDLSKLEEYPSPGAFDDPLVGELRQLADLDGETREAIVLLARNGMKSSAIAKVVRIPISIVEDVVRTDEAHNK